ncbi:hypothetical protein ABID21_004221 [Pseudorhizobium tarimense]|uniref:Uncharacterized protein n=1 Tax=Pseudorhizobium tarimense TaxID=1079109 RepID=A0ABV2HC29_9HYPH
MRPIHIAAAAALLCSLAATHSNAADMVEWPQRPAAQTVYRTDVTVYNQLECEDLLITYRKPPAAELVRVCHPLIF